MAAFIYDIVIVGAGPAGAVAAALLNKQGFNVCVLEKQHFPRFVIGESLLPYAMDILQEAGLLRAVQAAGLGFQYKNGFAFSWGDRYTSFSFLDKFSAGNGTAFNVQRAEFDLLLIREAEKQGVAVRFGETLKKFDNEGNTVLLTVERDNGDTYDMEARFVLYASGFYRALPRLMNWELPPETVMRQVHFTHIDDRITSPKFDRNKNLVCIHPEHRDVWVWFIPFANGRSSIGVVGEEHYLSACCSGRCWQSSGENPSLGQRLFIEHEMEKFVEFRRFASHECCFFVDFSFTQQVHSNFYHCRTRTFSITGLKEPQFTVLHSKFHILHIMIMTLKLFLSLL